MPASPGPARQKYPRGRPSRPGQGCGLAALPPRARAPAPRPAPGAQCAHWARDLEKGRRSAPFDCIGTLFMSRHLRCALEGVASRLLKALCASIHPCQLPAHPPSIVTQMQPVTHTLSIYSNIYILYIYSMVPLFLSWVEAYRYSTTPSYKHYLYLCTTRSFWIRST